MTGMLVASAFACVFADALMSATSGAEVLAACTIDSDAQTTAGAPEAS